MQRKQGAAVQITAMDYSSTHAFDLYGQCKYCSKPYKSTRENQMNPKFKT